MCTIGERIAIYRKANNLTQKEFAEKISSTACTISQIENNSRGCSDRMKRRIEIVIGDDNTDCSASERVSRSLYNVGRILYNCRRSDNITITNLAKILGYSQSCISRVENGQMTENTNSVIASALDDMVELFSDEITLRDVMIINDFLDIKHIIPNNSIYKKPEFNMSEQELVDKRIQENIDKPNNVKVAYQLGQGMETFEDNTNKSITEILNPNQDDNDKQTELTNDVISNNTEVGTDESHDNINPEFELKNIADNLVLSHIEPNINNIFEDFSDECSDHIKLLLFDDIYKSLNDFNCDDELIKELISFVDKNNMFNTEILKLKLDSIKK